MRQVVISFTFILCINHSLIAQEKLSKVISIGFGVNTFLMKDLSTQSEAIKEGFPIDNAEITNSFPPYYGYEINYREGLNEKFSVGGLAHYTSTGARISYADYSGMLEVDQLADYYAIGGIASYVPFNSDTWEIYIDLKTNLIYSTYQIESRFQIWDEPEQNELVDFYSLGIGIQPEFSCYYKLGKIFLGANLGYEINISGKLKVWGEDGYIVGPNNEPLKVDWTGFRSGLSIAYSL